MVKWFYGSYERTSTGNSRQGSKRAWEIIYGERLRGVYLYGSAARDQLTPDSDIDIAIVLDKVKSAYEEIEYTGQLGSDVSLEYDTLVTFLFVNEDDYNKGRFAIHRNIKEEGIAAWMKKCICTLKKPMIVVERAKEFVEACKKLCP